ncbi:MAG: hypothetical protein Q8M92_00110, partial [Candidatus Subteraquimicrobiales bacterium]|nr:hypothetical protein [Candidatus Subteraquimicrobiales bacterium]
MQKLSFVPTVVAKIHDKDEYNSRLGEKKRAINKSVGVATGLLLGLGGGAAIGYAGGKGINKIAPKAMRIGTGYFNRVAKRTKVDPIAHYRASQIKLTGRKPWNVPPQVYLPIFGAIAGMPAGALTGEYRTIKKMEEAAGIEDKTTPKRYMKEDALPLMAGVGAAIIATDALKHIGKKVKHSAISGAINSTAAAGGLGAGLATESLLSEMAKSKRI